MPARVVLNLLAVAAAIGVLLIARGPAREGDTDGRPSPWDAVDQELEAKRVEGLRVGEELRHLADELAGGRATLAAAAEKFLAVSRERPLLLEAVRRSAPGATDEEVAARHAVRFALNQVKGPARADLHERLADEFCGLFPGADPLPDN